MPFLRVIRDKRGYETTYLMHWYREGARQRSRILYVFRSPAGVRVGRNPLEPEVVRQIEAQHPDIPFDWKVVRENQQVIEPAPEQRRRRPRAEEAAAAPVPAPAVARAPEPAAPLPQPAIPATIEGDTPDAQIAFLTQLYPTLRERIPQRTQDPVRLAALLALADRLNPAAWTDADQITAGLQQASEALERLSHVFARRRRRPRKKPRPADAAAAGPAGRADLASEAPAEPQRTAAPEPPEPSEPSQPPEDSTIPPSVDPESSSF